MRRRRRPGRGSAAASGLLGDLVEIFQPSRRHVEAELERRRLDVQRPGSGAAPFDVDLESGVAYVPPPGTRPPPAAADASGRRPGRDAPDRSDDERLDPRGP